MQAVFPQWSHNRWALVLTAAILPTCWTRSYRVLSWFSARTRGSEGQKLRELLSEG